MVKQYFIKSFADRECSGKATCQIEVYELFKHATPCPLELSSFFEASSHVYLIRVLTHTWLIVNLQSFLDLFKLSLLYFPSTADELCSGKMSCQIQVYSIVTQFGINPCPLELSSFMETSYSCNSGNSCMSVSV